MKNRYRKLRYFAVIAAFALVATACPDNGANDQNDVPQETPLFEEDMNENDGLFPEDED